MVWVLGLWYKYYKIEGIHQMKLSEIKPLFETAGLAVYKVSSDAAIHVYYGYTIADNERESKRIFLSTATAAGNSADRQGRGVARWLREHADNGGKIDARDPDNIKGFDVEIVWYPDSPEDAFEQRNEHRMNDDMSITGPTYMPIDMWERVKTNDPQRAERWKAETRRRGQQAIADMSPEEREAYEGKVRERVAKATATRASNRANKEAKDRALRDASKPAWLRSDAPKTIRAVSDDEV